MANGGGNIYQTARKSAGLTQEAAAERLAVSLTSLRAYEGGERVPAGDVLFRSVCMRDGNAPQPFTVGPQGILIALVISPVNTGVHEHRPIHSQH